MKKLMIIVLVITSIISAGATPVIESDPLLKLTKIATHYKNKISNWEVTIKETLNISIEEAKDKIKSSAFVSRIEDDNSIKLIFDDAEPTANMNIQYVLISHKKTPLQVELIAVLKGKQWNEEIKNEYKRMSKKTLSHLFTKRHRTFTCIELIEDDTIESGTIVSNFATTLGVLHMDKQEDKVKNSRLKNIYYGYTPLWEEKITIKGEPFNLQIAVTELENGKLAYKIGTPILINEY